MQFLPVSNMSEILDIVFDKTKKKTAGRPLAGKKRAVRKKKTR